MKRKGFTLVELLAVIIILGLLALLIVPKVNSIVKESKVKSYEVSINNLVKSLNSIAIDKKANLIPFDGCSIDFDFDENTCDGLNLNGKMPTTGNISVDGDGNVVGGVGYGNDIYLVIDNKILLSNKNVEYSFNYTGGEQLFTVVNSGYYKLEVWGAQGGSTKSSDTVSSIGGYGGYSVGYIHLNENDNIYINVGGEGSSFPAGQDKMIAGGYNGGGASHMRDGSGTSTGSGGGATHIATVSGKLSTLSSSRDSILIVAGGGGGGHTDTDGTAYNQKGGNAGGYIGSFAVQLDNRCFASCTLYNYPSGGTQANGGLGVPNFSTGVPSSTQYVGSFGAGASGSSSYGGGGSGFFGGGSGMYVAGGGGSGYIGNPLLFSKYMICFDCQECSEKSTKTISINDENKVNEEPISGNPKKGNGFAKITFLGEGVEGTSSNSSLPAEYVKVDYLESTGTQYINTEYIPGPLTDIDIDFSYVGVNNASTLSWYPICGERSSGGATYFAFWIHKDNRRIAVNYGVYDSNGAGSDALNANVRYDLKNRGSNFYLDGNMFTSSDKQVTKGTTPIYIFTIGNGTGVESRHVLMKLYLFKIYENGELVRYMIPCYRKSDNVAGLYDTVGNKFYTNSGTGEFLISD